MGTLPSPEKLYGSLSNARFRSGADDHVRSGFPPPATALRYFDDVFRETSAVRPQDVQAAFKLRYQVYCLDRGFENAESCPGGLEQDRFDDHALHCLLRERVSATPIGTVRLVRPGATPTWFAELPLAEYAPQEAIEEIMRLPAGSTAEVSRFAITRSAREILHDIDRPKLSEGSDPTAQGTLGDRLLPYMSLGLIRGLVRLSAEHGVTHWSLAAEPSLLRRLRNFGLHFQNAGPLVEHRGLRQICYARVSDLFERAREERPDFWDVMTVGGFLVSDAMLRTLAA